MIGQKVYFAMLSEMIYCINIVISVERKSWLGQIIHGCKLNSIKSRRTQIGI